MVSPFRYRCDYPVSSFRQCNQNLNWPDTVQHTFTPYSCAVPLHQILAMFARIVLTQPNTKRGMIAYRGSYRTVWYSANCGQFSSQLKENDGVTLFEYRDSSSGMNAEFIPSHHHLTRPRPNQCLHHLTFALVRLPKPSVEAPMLGLCRFRDV